MDESLADVPRQVAQIVSESSKESRSVWWEMRKNHPQLFAIELLAHTRRRQQDGRQTTDGRAQFEKSQAEYAAKSMDSARTHAAAGTWPWEREQVTREKKGPSRESSASRDMYAGLTSVAPAL